VTDPDPNIIARFSESPLFPGDKQFKKIPGLRQKYKKLERNIMRRRMDPVKKIKAIYDFVDWDLRESGVVEHAVCQKGCAHCCYLDVDVSLIEALYISKHTGYKVVSRQTRIRKGYHLSRHYCPFLDQNNGTCTIYEWRPLACRCFFTFDHPKFCADDLEKHAIFTHDASDLIWHFATQLMRMGNFQYADIREYFKDFTTDPYQQVYGQKLQWDYT